MRKFCVQGKFIVFKDSVGMKCNTVLLDGQKNRQSVRGFLLKMRQSLCRICVELATCDAGELANLPRPNAGWEELWLET